MAIKEKILVEKRFVDNRSNISSELIDACTSVAELLNMKLIIESNLIAAKMSIETAKGEAAAEGKFLNPTKWAGLNGYRGALGFLSQKIQYRLRELNYDKQNKADDSQVLFKRAAKRILTGAVYDQIIEEVKRLEAEESAENLAAEKIEEQKHVL